MIEVARKLDVAELHEMLERKLKPRLTPDVSNYAKGRLRAWLRYEPMLTKEARIKPGVLTSDATWEMLHGLVGWPFDYCLVTYSGDGERGIGITPHRDASYADFEAYSLTVSGTAIFRYWQGRNAFGKAPNEHEYNPKVDPPTATLTVGAGDLLRFNCKNMHAAEPSPRRWGLNFWRKKPA